MLKKIPKIIPPELLKILMEMGHGDEIVLADGNFPGASHARNLVRCDGSNVPDLLEAILELFPLDTFVEKSLAVMETKDGSEPEIWKTYKEIVKRYESEKFLDFDQVERFEFYERAKKSYAVVMTNEGALYANIILKKGVID